MKYMQRKETGKPKLHGVVRKRNLTLEGSQNSTAGGTLTITINSLGCNLLPNDEPTPFELV